MISGIVFFILLFIGVPLAIVLGLVTILYIVMIGNMPLLDSLPSRMFNSLQNFGLLAVPMFVLLGEVMNRGGITSRLIDFSKVVIGHFRGGLAYVNVLTNMMLASIIGSANAQSAIMSKVIVPAMEKEGYKRDFSAALTAASSIMGPLIPPSMIFIIYGVTVGVSVGELFLAGIIPGILFALAFGIMIYVIAKKQNFPQLEKAQSKAIWLAALKVLPALSIPTLLILGIITGVFTPTESAAFSVLIAIIIGFFFYKELKWRYFPSIFINTVITTSIVTFLIATSNIFGWVLTFQKIPQALTTAIVSISDNPIIFLLILNLILLIIGMIIDGMAAVILIGPILAPIGLQYGIDPVHLGVIMCLNLVIGLLTPPVGSVLFVTSGIAKVKIELLIRRLVPFLIASFIILILITYIPSITTAIPSFFGGK